MAAADWVGAHGGSVTCASSRIARLSLSVKPLLDRGKLNLPTVAAVAAHPLAIRARGHRRTSSRQIRMLWSLGRNA